MKLPNGLKHAVAMGANEVLMEWLDDIIEDPESVIDGDDLGSTYQPVLDDSMFEGKELEAMIRDLEPWAGAKKPALAKAAQLEAMVVAAGLDFARGMIAVATKNPKRVPPKVKPHMKAVEPIVKELERSIANGSFDEEAFDIQATVFGD